MKKTMAFGAFLAALAAGDIAAAKSAKPAKPIDVAAMLETVPTINDPSLLEQVIAVESRGIATARSAADAHGLMQIKEGGAYAGVLKAIFSKGHMMQKEHPRQTVQLRALLYAADPDISDVFGQYLPKLREHGEIFSEMIAQHTGDIVLLINNARKTKWDEENKSAYSALVSFRKELIAKRNKFQKAVDYLELQLSYKNENVRAQYEKLEKEIFAPSFGLDKMLSDIFDEQRDWREAFNLDAAFHYAFEELCHDPKANILVGDYYLAMLQHRFGNDGDALRAYAAGPNAVKGKSVAGWYARKVLATK